MSDYTLAGYFWSSIVAVGVSGPVLAALTRRAVDSVRSFAHCG